MEYDKAALAAVPLKGPVLFVANHPFDLVDGLATGHLATKIRPHSLIMTHSLLCQPPALAASSAMSAREVFEDNPRTKEIWIDLGKNAYSMWVDGVPAGDRPLMSIVFHLNSFSEEIEREVLKSHEGES